MRIEKLNDYICHRETSIVEAMKKIDENTNGILFVVDEKKHLCGSLTDGDVRRWLIQTGDLSSKVFRAMNPTPKYLFERDENRALSYMQEKHIKAVPLLDSENRIVTIVVDSERLFLVNKEKRDILRHIPVVIMAGGKGTRLYPYTKILPKPLIPIGDVPIIERIMNRFCEYGVAEFYLTVNYKKGMIRSYFSELNPSYEINYVEEDKPLGTAGSIKLIKKEFDTPVVVTNCDTLIDADYSDILEYHRESGNALTIVSALKNITVPYGVLHSKEHGVLTSIEEKPRLSYFINSGMYILNPELLKEIPDDTFYHMTDLIDALMKRGEQVGMYPISEDSFLDMGEFEEMRRMEKKLNIQ